MKTNIHRVNFDGTPNPNGNWYVWRETCDRCQKLIYDETTLHSDFEEADVDFCAECKKLHFHRRKYGQRIL